MDIINIILIVAAGLVLSFGISIFFHRDKEKKQFIIVFSLLALNLGLWSVTIILFRYVDNLAHAFILSKALYSIPIFIPVLFLVFTAIFIKDILSRIQKRLIITISVSVGFLLAVVVIFTSSIVGEVTIPLEGEKKIDLGNLYFLYVSHYFLFFSLSFFLLLKKYFTTTNTLLKDQIKILFVGTFFASMIGLVTNLLLPWFGYFELNWFANVMSIVFIGFIFYAILEYKLFNLKIVAIEIFAVLILTLLAAEVFLVRNLTELIVKLFLFLSIALLSYFLIRSAYREVESREKIEYLAKDLKNANIQLKEFDQRKSEFLSLASHQLRTPLTAIKGYASMLMEGTFGVLRAEQKDATSRIFESSKQLVVIVEDFLTLSRIEQNRLSYNFEQIDVQNIVEVVVDELKQVAQRKGISLSLAVDKGNYITSGDGVKIKQVFSNIIDNSIKYTPDGEVKVSLGFNDSKEKIIFKVKDTGVGMSEETVRTAFDKFKRGKNGVKVNVSGSGLGLYIAKKMIEAHEGRLSARSEGEGKGSEFCIELPIKTPH